MQYCMLAREIVHNRQCVKKIYIENDYHKKPGQEPVLLEYHSHLSQYYLHLNDSL